MSLTGSLQAEASLRQLNMLPFPPIDEAYDWCGGAPFEIQKRTARMLTENPRSYCLNSLGTGKTRSVLWSFDYLKKQGVAHKMLVVAPLSTMTFTWGHEILKATPHLRWTVLHGTREQRQRRLADLNMEIYIINHDGLAILHKELAKRTDIDVLVFDELAVYRNPVQRTKMAAKIADRFPIVWGLTGAPMPNEVTDVYNQIKLITPWRVPRHFTHFRDELMLRINQFRWLPKAGAIEKAFNYFQPSVRFTLDDVTELPEFVSQSVETTLSSEQHRVYHALRKHASAAVASGEVTAANAGVVMSKLLQTSCGWLYDSHKVAHDLGGTDRLDALLDVINAARNKVIVFTNYMHVLEGVVTFLAANKVDFGVVHGGVDFVARTTIFNTFQNTNRMKVLVAHPKCISHGLTFTAADTAVWFGPPLSAETYDQANARIRRVGQRHRQLFLHLKSTAMEGRVYTLLINRLMQQDSFLALLEDASWD